MLEVIASALPVLYKQLHQLPIILGPAVHRGKDTTHKILETMYFAHAWPQQCWKSCTDNNGSNTVVLRFGDHRTEEMLEVVGPKFWPVSNFRQQLPKIDDSMQQHGTGCADGTTCNVGQFWELLASKLARESRYGVFLLFGRFFFLFCFFPNHSWSRIGRSIDCS